MAASKTKETPVDREVSLCRAEVGDLLEVESGMSNKDLEFIESMKRQLDKGNRPSQAQSKWIHDLWDRHCKDRSN